MGTIAAGFRQEYDTIIDPGLDLSCVETLTRETIAYEQSEIPNAGRPTSDRWSPAGDTSISVEQLVATAGAESDNLLL